MFSPVLSFLQPLFPVLCERETSGVKHIQQIELYCVCRLPDEGDMAECEACKQWFHRHCMEIPDEVFVSTDVHWVCKTCARIVLVFLKRKGGRVTGFLFCHIMSRHPVLHYPGILH